jgi:adenylate cyclase
MKSGLKSFSKYVPIELVRNLMHKGQVAVLGGEMRELTIYFSDIADFTTISEKLGPEKLVDSLGGYLEEMSQLIMQHHGTLDKYIGDAIMAFWGAPMPVEKHAAEACHAALESQCRLDEMQRDWIERGHPVFHSRIGINSGLTLVGNIGSANRMNYTVMGDPVNVASRLEALCKLYGVRIMLGEYTAQLVNEEFVTRPLDKIAVKGKEQGIRVYELCGLQSEVGDEELAYIDAYRNALEIYFSRNFHAAAAQFEVVLKLRKQDLAAELLLARVHQYITSPPPKQWSGVFSIQHK